MTTQISGTTGVSRVQDGVVVQADLAANVVGNGPAFSAYQTAQQLSTSTPAKLSFQTELFDTSGAFADSRFTARVAGYYMIGARCQLAGATPDMTLMLRQNGVNVAQGDYGALGGAGYGNPITSVADFLYLDVGDYVEVYIASVASLNTAPGRQSSAFYGYLARAV